MRVHKDIKSRCGPKRRDMQPIKQAMIDTVMLSMQGVENDVDCVNDKYKMQGFLKVMKCWRWIPMRRFP